MQKMTAPSQLPSLKQNAGEKNIISCSRMYRFYSNYLIMQGAIVLKFYYVRADTKLHQNTFNKML